MSQADEDHLSLLAVFAHPDDEAVACGGLLARCAAEGVRTGVVCLTRGGLGQLDDPVRVQMGELRTRELQASAGVLGVTRTFVLDYRNGFLPWADRHALDADIQASIVRTRPAAVVTFDDDGLYWHPDHIVVHERVTAVLAAMEEPAPALYYASIPKGAMRAAWRDAAAAARRNGDTAPVPPVALGVEVDAYGLFTTPATLRLDVGRYATSKLRAIRCHQSQVRGDALDRLPEDAAPEALGLELYRRADVGSSRPTFLDCWASPPGPGTTTP